jgi:hypothetical protein
MAINIKDVKGHLCPIVTCDLCGKEIKKQDGGVLYDLNPFRVLFAHKGDCFYTLDHGTEPRLTFNADLGVFLTHTLMNVGYRTDNKIQDVVKMARFDANLEIG